MGMKWTEEQRKVITLRDRNILVSRQPAPERQPSWYRGS